MPIQSHVEDKAFRSFCAINRTAVKKSLGDNSSEDKVNAQLKELWKVFSKSVHEEDIIDMKNFKDNINSRFTDEHPLEKIFTSFDKKLDEFYLIHSKENAPAKLYELRETLTDEFYPLKEKFLTLCTDLENEDYMTDYTEDVLREMESDIENMFCRFDNDIKDILEKLGDDEKVGKKIQDMSTYIKESFILFDNKLEQLRFDYLV